MCIPNNRTLKMRHSSSTQSWPKRWQTYSSTKRSSLRTACRRASRRWTRQAPADRARLARCWVDSAFETRVLQSTNTTAVELGLNLGATPIQAVKITPHVHIVIALPCAPVIRHTLRQKTYWNKSRAYRSRIVREPRAVLAAGTSLPDDIEVRVHDSTAERRYIVLPLRPEGTSRDDRSRADCVCDTRLYNRVAVPRIPR